MSNEAALQSQIREAFPRETGGVLYRNNVGACEDKTGRLIRYGLANESAQMNKVIKSSDLIGPTPVQCFVPAIGWTVLGVFTAIECKRPGWHMTPGDERAIAQARFHDIVRAAGGYAGFATSLDDMRRIIGRANGP